MQGNSDKTNYSTVSDGDLWAYFVKAVRSKGAKAVKFTWVKGHATDDKVEQGITTKAAQNSSIIAD